MENQEDPKQTEPVSSKKGSKWLPIGIGVGLAIGVANDNTAIGLAIGVAVGLSLRQFERSRS